VGVFQCVSAGGACRFDADIQKLFVGRCFHPAEGTDEPPAPQASPIEDRYLEQFTIEKP
jgi:hypothetical protein